MFGLVNKGLEDMVCSQYGEETWEEIKSKAEVEIEAFISMDAYPDDITYRLVDAASAVMELPATDILEAFGRYWILFTATEGYGSLMEMAGDNPSMLSTSGVPTWSISLMLPVGFGMLTLRLALHTFGYVGTLWSGRDLKALPAISGTEELGS